MEAMVAHLNSEIAVLSQVDAALNEISSRVMNQSVVSIDKMITTGLKFVFDDMKLEFRTSIEKVRGKTSVRFSLLQDGTEAPIMDSYGGGVIVVAGVLLRIVTVMTLNARRFILLDETLAHVSKQYVPNISRLLNKLCAELGFDILMVTHTDEFAEFANTHFRARQEPGGGTVFDKVMTNGGNDE